MTPPTNNPGEGNPAAERLRGLSVYVEKYDREMVPLDDALAALLHERRATVERAVNYFLPFIDRDFAGQDAQDRIDARIAAFAALDATASEDGVTPAIFSTKEVNP